MDSRRRKVGVLLPAITSQWQIPNELGERHEEEKQNESFKSDPEKKKCEKLLEKVKRGKKVSLLNKMESV
jgi:hypothetical protein